MRRFAVGVLTACIALTLSAPTHAQSGEIYESLQEAGDPLWEQVLRRIQTDAYPRVSRQCMRRLRRLFQEMAHGIRRGVDYKDVSRIPHCLDRYFTFRYASVSPRRRRRHLPSKSLLIRIRNKNIVYVRLPKFDAEETRFLYDAVVAANDAGVTDYIFDLRQNPGGLVASTLRALRFFSPRAGAVIITVRSRSGVRTVRTHAHGLVHSGQFRARILVGPRCASACEMFVGTLRAWYPGRVLLMGKHTYGKGTIYQVQNIEGRGLVFSYTNGVYYIGPHALPVRKKVGLAPDIRMPIGTQGENPLQESIVLAALRALVD